MNRIYDIAIPYIKVVIETDEENEDVKHVLISINQVHCIFGIYSLHYIPYTMLSYHL